MFFDTHAHLDDEQFSADADEVICGLNAAGIGMYANIGSDVESSKKSLEFAEKYPFVYAAVGIHPEFAAQTTEKDIEEIARLAAHPKAVAIGEIGLDYHYGADEKEAQKKWFDRQMALSAELNMPFTIHDREAHKDCMDIIKKYDVRRTGGIMHCFSGSAELAREAINLGMVVALGGSLTFKNNVKTVRVAQEIPLEYIVLETDSPYLAPVPNRGKRNTPAGVKLVAEKIAEIKNIPLSEVERITTENAKRVYRID